MTYCRLCGVELSYKLSKNNKWIPCNALTGEPHFCEQKEEQKRNSGLNVCKHCGKPIFKNKAGKLMDYTTLKAHLCKTGDVARYRKYLQKQKKLNKVKDKL